MASFKKTFFVISIIFFSAVNFYAQPKKLELDEIIFEGNNFISSSELSTVILAQETPNWLSKFLNSFSNLGEPPIYFDSTLIPGDIIGLKRFYQSKGFFQTRISSEYSLDTLDLSAKLMFQIHEGPPVYFKNFNVKGLEKLPYDLKKESEEFVQFDSTKIYSDNILMETRENILRFLRDQGYMLASAKLKPIVIDTVEHSVKTELDVEIGKRYIIDGVRVYKTGPGKNLVNDKLLADIVNINPGNYYSFYDIQRGQVRLYRTNLFSSALISPVIADTVGNRVPLKVNADIGLLYDISPEIIVNNEDDAFNLGLGIGFSRKNFLGDARQLTFSASAAAQDIYSFITSFNLSDTLLSGYADARITVEQPYIFGKTINTKLAFYNTLQKRRNEWNAKLFGAKINLDFELPRYTYFNSFQTYLIWERSEFIYRENYYINALSNYLYNFFPKEVVDSIITEEQAAGNISTNTISKSAVLGFDVGANKTNDLLFPTKGYYLNLVLEDGNSIPFLLSKAFGKSTDRPVYVKVLLSTAFFPNIFPYKKSAFGIKFKIGNIFTYHGDKAKIPFNQRFYAGGSNSVRGWRTKDLTPSEPEINIEDVGNQDFQDFFLNNITPGGFFLVESSLEARLRFAGSLGGALFADFGNTFNSYHKFRWDKIAVAGGFGIRFYSSFAPLRLDFGFKVYDPDDRRSMLKKTFGELFELHFGIGEAF